MPCRWNMTPWSIRKHALRQVPVPALLSQRTVCSSFCAAVDRIFPIFILNANSRRIGCRASDMTGFVRIIAPVVLLAGAPGSASVAAGEIRPSSILHGKAAGCDQPDHGCDDCDTVWKYRGRASGIERRWACHFDFRFATRNPAGYPQRCGRSLPHHERAGMRIRRSIARAVVPARQERIWAERQGRGGAAFRVCLPSFAV